MNQTYITNHLGEDRENYYRAVSPPIINSINFAFDSVNQMRDNMTDELNRSIYSSGCNPTVAILRKKIAALAGGEDALILNSGSTAMVTAILSHIEFGDHIICVDNPYFNTKKLLNNTIKKFGITTTYIDGKDITNFEKELKFNTKLIILESPNSITFELQDLEEVVKIAKANNIITIMDNSYASPIFQKPLEFGIDITVHSATKYLSGHSDVIAGIIISSKKHIKKIFENEYSTFGGAISPNNAWLLLRSLRTFSLRMNHISTNTETIVEWLKGHKKVKQIYYPFDKNNIQYDLAKKQMSRASGLFSMRLDVKTTLEVERFVNSLQSFHLAVSWGGHESLVFPICVLNTTENEHCPNYPFDLIRFSIGLDEPEDLIKDLDQAFNII